MCQAPPAREVNVQRRWLDVTRPLLAGMEVWPGDPPVALARVLAHEQGDPCQVSVLSASVHAGTHVDAPCHYLPGGSGVEAMPPEVCLGAARVVAGGGARPLSAEALVGLRIGRGQRLLLRMTAASGSNEPQQWGALSLGAARVLAARRVALVGTDLMSIGPAGAEGDEVHRVLLEAGVWIVEGLDLASVPVGPCDLVCLPLRIPGADGAPARVLLRPR